MAEGALAGLTRWPVKSLGGERLDAARLDRRGVGGDRPDAPGDRLDPADPPPPTLRAPDGTAWGWDDPLGRPAEPRPATGWDVSPRGRLRGSSPAPQDNRGTS